MLPLQALFLVHAVEGREVWVNSDSVITVSESGHLVTDKAKCTIMLNDAKFLTVIETCDEVRKRMEAADGR